MKKQYLLFIVFILISGSVFASPLPELPLSMDGSPMYNFLPPPIESEFPLQPAEQPFPESQTFPPQKISLDAVQSASGVLYYATLREWGIIQSAPPQQIQTLPNTAIETLDSSVIGTIPVVSDSNQDVEPSVISINKNGTDWTTTVYIKYVSGIAKNYFSTTADFSTFYRGQLPLSPGYSWSGDPLLAENPYTTGVAPGRVYLTGLLLNGGTSPTAIAVWHSDDGGRTWSSPTVVAQSGDSSSPVDKPAIAVSWHSGSLGTVYVAYVKGGATKQLFVAKSTDGGVTFWNPIAVPQATGNINGAQILVNYYYGDVYALWTDFSMNAIRLSRSTNFGSNWTVPETAASGNMVLANIKGGVRAGSLPMARFNHIANKICVVWYEWQQGSPTNCNQLPAGSCTTDVYYTAKSPSGWQAKVRVNDNQSNDQFMPALDYDTSGNLIVTFYDRRNDSNNLLYDQYMSRINSNGSRLQPDTRVSTFQSNPQFYTGQTGYANFIGDYQDIWSHTFVAGEYYISSWVGIPTTTGIGDIYFSAIQP